MSKAIKNRSDMARVAYERRGGPQAHRSTNRNRTRAQQRARAIKEQS